MRQAISPRLAMRILENIVSFILYALDTARKAPYAHSQVSGASPTIILGSIYETQAYKRMIFNPHLVVIYSIKLFYAENFRPA